MEFVLYMGCSYYLHIPVLLIIHVLDYYYKFSYSIGVFFMGRGGIPKAPVSFWSSTYQMFVVSLNCTKI